MKFFPPISILKAADRTTAQSSALNAHRMQTEQSSLHGVYLTDVSTHYRFNCDLGIGLQTQGKIYLYGYAEMGPCYQRRQKYFGKCSVESFTESKKKKKLK